LKIDWGVNKKITGKKPVNSVSKAYYLLNNTIELLHEKSTFVFINDEWKYQDGVLYDTQIAKNEICFCGSKKKYKRCCYIPD